MDWQTYPVVEDGMEHTVVGNLRVLLGLHSPQCDNSRDILVYLPPSYEQGEQRYPVVYMHDGQNLFDAATSFSGEWRVDETLEAAGRERGLEAIVVGIPNAGDQRLEEYSPFVDAKKGGGRGDDYLAFVVDTVKPLVDQSFRTRPERDSTVMIGSSMGGLISLYAFFRRPEVFGAVGVMSPSLWFAGGAIFPFVLTQPRPAGRIHLDTGTAEGNATLRDARRMRDLLVAKGYTPGTDFEYIEQRGAGHTEAAWAGRLGETLEFLLG